MTASVTDIFDLEGKTAVVTGTSAGIGTRLARTLVMAGARVVAIARRRTELDDEASGTGRLTAITADLAERDQVEWARPRPASRRSGARSTSW